MGSSTSFFSSPIQPHQQELETSKKGKVSPFKEVDQEFFLKDTEKNEDEEEDFNSDKQMKTAQEAILKVAHYLALKECSLRDVFKDYIYDEMIDGQEFELVAIRVFSDIAKNEMDLQNKHIQAISILLSDHFIGESFDYNFFEEIFHQMGVIQKASKLDNKSLRIFNRLKKYLEINTITNIEKFLEEGIYEQPVKVQGEQVKVIE